MNLRFPFFAASIFLHMVLGNFTVEAQTDGWKSSVYGSIEDRQYQFHNSHDNSFMTVNNASGIRITCQPLTQTIENKEGYTPFTYSLALTGIHIGQYQVPLYDVPAYTATQAHLLESHRHFSIEYRNDRKGLKQNFILPERINLHKTIAVQLQLSSADCKPILKNKNISIQCLKNGKSVEMARYEALKVYDARGTVLPAVFAVNGQQITIEVDQQNAVYPITIDPLSNTPSTQVIGSQASMQLGYCVSTAGDVNGDGYSDVIVGAPKYDNGQANEGAAFVYLGSANGLATSFAWSTEGNQLLANYGVNVSEAGDVNGDGFGDVIIGAEKYDNGQTDEGMAFVFHGSASGLSATANWTYESNQASAELGFIVSTAGDINGDGFSDVIVGAPLYDNGQTDEGVALIFHGSAAGLAATPNTTLEQNQATSSFGWSVSSAGDVNSDGFADVIVSAVYFDNGQADEGKAWVYLGTAAGINVTPNWTNESNQATAYYGENVSWAGDLNGDGYCDVVVGADYNEVGAGQTDEGRVYVYHGSAAGVNATVSIVLERNQALAYFGVGVNGAGDVNGDGYGDLIVGAYYYDNGETDEGAAFVYYGSSTGLSQTLFTTLDANQASSEYGISVCSAGDVNGDGFSDVVVGAYSFDQVTPSAIADAGGFFVYNGKPENIGTTDGMTYASTQASAGLGNFVTCVGDVNRDGFSDLAVGASLFDNTQADRGVVYIFHGSATGYAATPSTTIDGPAFASANFGGSIGAAGDVNGDGFSDIIVGAPGLFNGQTAEGAFYIYLGSASGINTTVHLGVESNLANAALGFSVAGAGDVNGDGYSDVIVGANGYTAGQTNEGRAYVYYGSATGVDATADWQYETNVASERFGACVAGVGDANGDGYSDIVVLSSGFSNGQTNEGRMHYFLGDPAGLQVAPTCLFETNIANAGLNRLSCTYAGDINGDGFNDVAIGISTYNGGQTNEGLLRIYYGAFPNLNFSVIQNVESNVTNGLLGSTIGFGGDVNGDGYNDLVSGSPAFNNGATANEGIARVYTGSAGGLSTTPAFTLELNVAGNLIGSSVSSAGDINGDGYSDMAIGASSFDVTTPSALADAGKVYVFYGNNSHNILPLSMRSQQYKSDLSTIVQTSNGTFETNCNFGISHGQKAHMGRERAALLYEVRGHPHPFSNSGSAMNTSVSQSGIQGSFTNLGLTGSTLTMPASAVPPMGFPKWRTRVKYHVIDAIDGQRYGRWFYGGIHDKQDRSIKVSLVTCGILPIEMISYNVACSNGEIKVQWKPGNESQIASYVLYASADGQVFTQVAKVDAANQDAYSVSLENTDETRLVRLVVVDNNLFQHEQFTLAVDCVKDPAVTLSVYPNPSSAGIYVSLPDWDSSMGEITATTIVDLQGKTVYQYDGQAFYIDVTSFQTGFYQVNLLTSRGRKFSSRFVRM